MINRNGELIFTDWELMQLADWTTPLGWCQDSWLEWAAQNRVSGDEATHVLDKAFRNRMSTYVEPPAVPVDSIAPTFRSMLKSFLDDAPIAVMTRGIPQWRAECTARIGNILPDLISSADLIRTETARLDLEQAAGRRVASKGSDLAL